jgi:hypothetical protein
MDYTPIYSSYSTYLIDPRYVAFALLAMLLVACCVACYAGLSSPGAKKWLNFDVRNWLHH